MADNKVIFELVAEIKSFLEGFDKASKSADQASGEIARKLDDVVVASQNAGTKVSDIFKGMFASQIATKGLDAVISGVKSIGDAMIGGNAEMETYTTQFATLMGSADAAKERLKALAKFGAETPFELPEIARAEKVLLGFGLNGKKAMEMFGKDTDQLRTLIGDIAAGTGQQFETIANYMGKFSAGSTGEVLMRFQELGIVTKQQMAEMGVEFSKSGEMVSPLPKALEAVVKITEGKFAGGMKALSGTFDGMKSTLSDTLQQLGVAVGAPLFDVMKEGLSELLNVLNSEEVQNAGKSIAGALGSVLKPLSQMLPVLVSGVSGLLAVLGPVLNVVGAIASGIATNLPVIGATVAALGLLSAVLNANMIAAKAGLAIEAAMNVARGLSLAGIKAKITGMFTATAATVSETGATGGATIAQWAWNTALAANPIGAVIAAVVALTAVITALVISADSATEAALANNETNIKAAEAQEGLITSQIEAANTTAASAEKYKRLRAELDAGNLTTAQASAKTTELAGLQKELGDQYPKLIDSTDQYGLSLKGIDEIIEGTKEQINGLNEDMLKLHETQRQLATEKAALEATQAWEEFQDNAGAAVGGFADDVADFFTTTSNAERDMRIKFQSMAGDMARASDPIKVTQVYTAAINTLKANGVKATDEAFSSLQKMFEANLRRIKSLDPTAGAQDGKQDEKKPPPKTGGAKASGKSLAQEEAEANLDAAYKERKGRAELAGASRIELLEIEKTFLQEKFDLAKRFGGSDFQKREKIERIKLASDLAQKELEIEKAAKAEGGKIDEEQRKRRDMLRGWAAEDAARDQQRQGDAAVRRREDAVDAIGLEMDRLEANQEFLESIGLGEEGHLSRMKIMRGEAHIAELRLIDEKAEAQKKLIEIELRRLQVELSLLDAAKDGLAIAEKQRQIDKLTGQLGEIEDNRKRDRQDKNADFQQKERDRTIKEQRDAYKKQEADYQKYFAGPMAQETGKFFKSFMDETMSGAERWNMLWQDMSGMAIDMLTEIGVKWLEQQLLGLVMGATATGAAVAQGTAMAAAYAPAAAMVSLASFGANALPASAGISSTVALSQLLSIPALAEGGIAMRPTFALIGEGKEPEAIVPLSDLARVMGGGAQEAKPQRMGVMRTESQPLRVNMNANLGVSAFSKGVKSAEIQRSKGVS